MNMVYVVTVSLTYQLAGGESISSSVAKYYYTDLMGALRRTQTLKKAYSDTAMITLVRQKGDSSD